MDEPPIASPLGEAFTPTPPTPALPVGLKLLVAVSLLAVAFAALQCVLALQSSSPGVYGYAPWLWAARFGIRALLIVGLLWRNKFCWWGTQISNVYSFLIFMYAIWLSLLGHTASANSYLPPTLSEFVMLMELTLFLYLLAPSVRCIFFSKTKEVSE